MNENMLANFKFVVCSPDAAAAQTDLDGAVIDMAQDEGYDGICLVAHLGDVAATAVPVLKLMGSATSNGASPAVENSVTLAAAIETVADDVETEETDESESDQNDKLVVLDTRCPANRYVFSRLTRGAADAAVNSVIAILYKARKLPVTQGADVIGAVYDWVLGT